MSPDNQGDRKSQAESIKVPDNLDEIARREARNALRQFDTLVRRINLGLDPNRPFRLRLSIVLELNRVAIDGLSEYAGVFRPGGVKIQGSKHEPPEAHLVPELVEGMCDYVSNTWNGNTAVHLAAYVMWRLNWIHPFVDGNGRTARAVSYLVLCVRSGFQLPGKNTIPEQIADNKTPYYEALEAADLAWKERRIDLTDLENLLGDKLATQLLEVYQDATGSSGELARGSPSADLSAT